MAASVGLSCANYNAGCKAARVDRRGLHDLRRAFATEGRYAVECGYWETPPVLPRLPRVGQTVVAALTSEALDRVLAVSVESQRLAVLLAVDAGLRNGEVRGLRWRDVDLNAGRHGLVALDAKAKPWTGSALLKAFQRTCKRAELDEGWRFHDLRHYYFFFVTALLQAGVGAYTVKTLAGRSDLGTTQRNVHATETDLAEAIGRLRGTG